MMFNPGCLQGFKFHHAEADYVMLTHWLQDTPSSLPSNASHQVGVGVCVFNNNGELLVVKERHGPAAKRDIWKVPTGLVDPGEHFSTAAEREVLEETVRSIPSERVLQGMQCAYARSSLRAIVRVFDGTVAASPEQYSL